MPKRRFVISYQLHIPVITYQLHIPVISYQLHIPVINYRLHIPVISYQLHIHVISYQLHIPIISYQLHIPVISYHLHIPVTFVISQNKHANFGQHLLTHAATSLSRPFCGNVCNIVCRRTAQRLRLIPRHAFSCS
jgi:hypothetical protein